MLVTKKAIEKIKQISDDEGIGYYSIRVKLKSGGCAGFIRDIEFDNVIRDNDEVIAIDNVKIIIDEVSFQYLNDTTIDYECGLMEAGFKFISKNITGTCGCKKSVSF